MWNRRSKNTRKRTNRPLAESGIEHLETRALLAGNVIASLSGGNLTVRGDAAANSIEITVLDNKVQVRGLDSTTINGGTAAFVIAPNTDAFAGSVRVSMKGGADTVAFNRDVKLNGPVLVYGDRGNDTIVSVGATFARGTVLYGNDGNDTFSLQDSTTNVRAVIDGGRGNDLVSLTNMAIVGPMMIRGGDGNDGISLNNATTTSWVAIQGERGDDNVTVHDSAVGGFLQVRTTQGDDAVMLDDNVFDGRVSVSLGSGADSMVARDSSTFNRGLSVHAGTRLENPTGDAVEIDPANVFNGLQRVSKEESSTVSTAANNRFDQATTGLLARATAADDAAKALTATAITALASADTNQSLTSDGVLITKDANVTISGTTTPGSTVTLDTNNDGQFDDGTVTADADGLYTANVVVTRRDFYTTDANANDELTGFQTIKLRSTITGETPADAEVMVDFIRSTDSLVKFESVDANGDPQEYFIEMWGAEAPGTVANFLNYSSSGRLNNSIIHRSADLGTDQGIIQGGGFTVNNGLMGVVPKDAVIASEFNSARGNIRGTISMAHPGDTNQGSSEWFVNLADIPFLNEDVDSRRHTVFGRVVGNGMTITDQIFTLTTNNLVDETGLSALTDVPLQTAFTDFARTLTGTVQTTANSTELVGTGTLFTTELQGTLVPGSPRSRIQIGGETFFVASITDDTHLTLTVAPASTGTDLTALTDFADDNQFVRFISVAEVLSIT